jgi:hypothetical protein
MRGAREQSPGHSTHIGQEVEVHYRWHAHYGRRVRRQYVERRAGGDVVHAEVAPGVVIVVTAWMLDPAACAGEFELGVLRARMLDAARAKARRGELRISVPIGYIWHREIGLGFDPNLRI